MQMLKEVTEWDFPNHIYFVERSKLIAYIKEGTEEVIKLKTPMPFTKTHRKFKVLKRL